MESVKDRSRAGSCAWVLARVSAALVLATSGLVLARVHILATWHYCLTQDHEPVPDVFTGTLFVWAIMILALLVLGEVLDCLPKGRWYFLPAMAAAAAVLSWLYVIGMGSPSLQPGDPPEAACWTMPTFPFTG